MKLALAVAVACGMCVVCRANAAVVVSEYVVNDTNKWQYDPTFKTIEILQYDADTFTFEAFDNSNNLPVDIDLIKVHSSVSGTISISLAASGSGRTYGAANVKGIDLRSATSAGNLAGLTISGDLGQITGVNVKDVSGSISAQAGKNIKITGSLAADISLTSATSANSDPAILITGAGPHLGDISLSSTGTHTGKIEISADYGGALTIAGSQSAEIKIDGDVSGAVTVSGAMNGHFVIGDAPDNSNWNRFDGGSVDHKNLSGTVILGAGTGGIDVTGELTGTLKVVGSIADGNNWIVVRKLAGGTVWVTGDMAMRRPTGGTEASANQGWLEIGDFEHDEGTVSDRTYREAVNHTGTVQIDGTLSGRVYVVGSSKIHFIVNTINSTTSEEVRINYADHINWGLGGITFVDEFRNPTSGNAIDVGTFTSGAIQFQPVTWPETASGGNGGVSGDNFDFAGKIEIAGNMEHAAKIDTRTCPTTDLTAYRAVDIRSRITVDGDMKGLIYAQRHLKEQIRIKGELFGDTDGDMTPNEDTTHVYVRGRLEMAGGHRSRLGWL